MVFVLVLVTIVGFVVIDLFIRLIHGRVKNARIKKEREAALDVGLRLDYSEEAPSLKRVSVPEPKARILAVDDEAVVLDSFRKILVLGGYSVDTVETGQEALGLLRKADYDFLFTDLKMPEMDGVSVVKAAHYFRPDVDVVVITGFATIESAVETMKHGATDYVQKPFTADELLAFIDAAFIRREDRRAKSQPHHVHLVTPSSRASKLERDFNVPAGLFVSQGHTWAGVYANGLLLVGLDDFAQKVFGDADEVILPEPDSEVAVGDTLFELVRGGRRMAFPAPAGGRIVAVNQELGDNPRLLNLKPYETGWVCWMNPANLPADLENLRVGADAVAWYEGEIQRYQDALSALGVAEVADPPEDGGATDKEDSSWKTIERILSAH